MPLAAHFLNVGQGDCTIIQFPYDRVGVVDINNLKCLDETTKAEKLQRYHASSEYIYKMASVSPAVLDREFLKKEEERLTDPLDYYDANVGPTKDVFRMIITHPDMDHMTGLHRLHVEDSRKSLLNFWHTGDHDFNLADTTDDEWESCPYDRRDWETYKSLRAGQGIRTIQNRQGAVGQFWTEDGVELWAPTKELQDLAAELQAPNVLSMILKISYKGRSILLGGDATADETWKTIYPEIDMKGVDVLKASHHGRKTGYYQPAVKEMSPWLTITSVGSVNHDATDSYRRYSEHTVSLRRTGDIKITIDDDGKIWYPPSIEQHWKERVV